MEVHKELISKLSAITYAGTQKIPISKVVRFLYHDLIALKNNGLSWSGIVDLLNSNDFGVVVNKYTFNNTILLIKKNPPIKTAAVEQVKAVDPVKAVEQVKAVDPVKAVEQVKAVDVSRELLNACFQKMPLAVQCIENGISIELVKSWQCGNFFQLSNQINGYLMQPKGQR
ncbi:MAG: hypothetical protein ACRC9N_11170 [Aeromonas sp.]